MTAPARVLVVEDDTTIREALVGCLEDEGFAVTAASDGRTGLERATADPPDLILLDMRLPVLDGWGFAREYHKTAEPRARVVVVSAATDAARYAQEIAADGWLAKPFALDQAVATVRRFIPADAGRGD